MEKKIQSVFRWNGYIIYGASLSFAISLMIFSVCVLYKSTMYCSEISIDVTYFCLLFALQTQTLYSVRTGNYPILILNIFKLRRYPWKKIWVSDINISLVCLISWHELGIGSKAVFAIFDNYSTSSNNVCKSWYSEDNKIE